MSEFSKEEFLLMLDVQSKAASQMTIVAEQLRAIAESNKIIVAKLSNGMSSDLKEVKVAILGSESEVGIKKSCENIRDNTKKSAQSVGIISVAVIVALALMQFVHWTSHLKEVKDVPKIDVTKVVEGLTK